MAKIIKYDNDAKQKLLAGIEKLEKAVSTTLGPAGKNVIIDEYGSIHSTKDGVTVAKSIVLKDPFENLGANAVKEVAQKSNDKVGDGTTTSTLLAATIFKNGIKQVALGANATQVKNGILKAAKKVSSMLNEKSVPIQSKEEIRRVCVVSANGDEEIGEMIADVMDKIGKDGVIKVEDGQTAELTSKIVEGMSLDNGWVSPLMVTSQEKNEAELDEALVLLVDKKITNIQELILCLQSVAQSGKPLFIIADDYAEDILATLVMNKLRGFNCCAIKSPSFGDNRKAILDDIAILVGGKVVSDTTGVKLESAVVGGSTLGTAKRILVGKDSTVIFGGYGAKEDIDARANALREQIKNCKEAYDKEKLQERLGKLTNGIGIISVGADTEAERKEKRDRVDDAFNAAKCAVRSGIVAGGGIALYNIEEELKNAEKSDGMAKSEEIGFNILVESLVAPIRKILENAGLNYLSILTEIDRASKKNLGYDVYSNKYCDMLEAGIIDPTEVVVNEVVNAASIAGLLLTTEALVVEESVDKTGASASCTSCNPGMQMY